MTPTAPPADPASSAADSGIPTVPPESAPAVPAKPPLPPDIGADAPADDTAQPSSEWADDSHPATALTWVDPDAVRGAAPTITTRVAASDTLADARPRGGFVRGPLLPLCVLLGLVGGYVGSTLLWPLDAVQPTFAAAKYDVPAAPPASITWPATGAAAVGVDGVGVTSSAAGEAFPIASITKVVSVLMILEKLPLAPGEQGPEFAFTVEDRAEFWSYRARDESSLDVPVDGVLTEYQMLQGVLMESAGNYLDRLVREVWGSTEAFTPAAAEWLAAHGLSDIHLDGPTGFERTNVGTPESLVRLTQIALSDPVFAEIVATKEAEIPGAGLIENTNELVGEPGILGVKTGTLEGSFNLLAAKSVTVGEDTLIVSAAVLDQDSNLERVDEARALLDQVAAQLQTPRIEVPKDTVVGTLTTEWGASASVLTTIDADVVLWDSAKASTSLTLDVGDDRPRGKTVGALTVAGPLETVKSPVIIDKAIPQPTAWWRLTHPLELFGADTNPK